MRAFVLLSVSVVKDCVHLPGSDQATKMSSTFVSSGAFCKNGRPLQKSYWDRQPNLLLWIASSRTNSLAR
jgi:hypothetical protein